MLRRFGTIALMFLFSVAMLSFSGCSKKTVVVDDPDGTRGVDDGRPQNPDDSDIAKVVSSKLVKVYFDFDKSDIRSDQQAQMEHNAKVLAEHATVNVTIEGHCDKRGTTEYNFALGERRANSVRSFLISRGVEAGRLTILSKGEEQPAVDEETEAAYGLNRRCEFIVTK
jgi:peptidoglycan-associated lipoprotein